MASTPITSDIDTGDIDTTPTARRTCPCCAAPAQRWLPVVYGPPAASVLAQARRGELVLGGVNHGRNEPRWHCTACEARFGAPRGDRDRFGRVLRPLKDGRNVAVRDTAPTVQLATAA